MGAHRARRVSRSSGRASHSLLLGLGALALGLAATPALAQPASPPPLAPAPQGPPEGPEGSRSVTRAEYSVRLRAPAPHWRLLSGEEAARVAPIAVAGAVEPGRCFGFILVEPMRGLTLEEYAQALINNSPLGEVQVEVAEAITYQGYESLRLVYSGDNERGGRARYLSYVFLRDGFAFQVSAGGKVGEATVSDLEVFSRAVTLLPEPVRGGSVGPRPLADAQELTWRARGGRAESWLARVSLTPPAGWEAQVGEAARALNGRAELGLSRRGAPGAEGGSEVDLSLLVRATPCALPKAEGCEAWARGDLMEELELMASPAAPRLELPLLGAPASFEPLDRPSTPFTYLLHTRVEGGRALQVLAWRVRGQAEVQDPDNAHAAWGGLAEGLSALAPLSDARAAALKAELAEALRGDEGSAARGDALRSHESWLRGEYRSFALRARWRLPAGGWRARLLPSSASTLSALVFEAPAYDLSGRVTVTRRGGGLIEAHREALMALKRDLGDGAAVVREGEGALGGGLSRWSELKTAGERPRRYRLHTALRDGVAAYVLSAAPDPSFSVAAALQVEGGLRLGVAEAPLATRSAQGEVTIASRQMRFELRGLPEGGALELHPDGGVGESSLSLTYEAGEALVGVVAVAHVSADPLDPLALEAARRLLPPLEGPSLAPERLWINGREGRRLAWSTAVGEASLYLVRRAPLVYAYFVLAPQGHALLKAGASPLRLLD